MDATERARLRALCETIPDGDVTPCCGRAGEDGHHSSWSLGMMPHGAALRAWMAGPLDLLALARAALPALLDALDAAERERDEARAEAERLRAIDQERREISPLALEAVRTVAREEEREACAKVVEGWLGEVRRVTRILVGAGITDGPAVDALRAAAGVLHGALDDIRARGAGGER